MTNSNNNKGLVARILGGKPTTLQKTIFWIMALSICFWPLAVFVAIFFFDYPMQSRIDSICRYGSALTILLYPLYLFPLLRLGFLYSKRIGTSWPYYFCPLVPVVVFLLFSSIGSSEYAEKKPAGYDPSTYKCINDTYATDKNHVYYLHEILDKADPASFRVINDSYSADAKYVWFNGIIIDGADPTTFVATNSDSSDLAHDNHDYYIWNHPLHVSDMNS